MQAAPKQERPAAWLFTLFLLVSLGIATGGFLYHRALSEHLKAEIQNEISSIANLKVREITAWRRDYLTDGESIAATILAVPEINQILRGHAQPEAQQLVSDWLFRLQKTKGYSDVALIAPDGETMFSTSHKTQPQGPIRQAARQAAESRQPFLSDLHMGETTNDIHLDLLVPVLSLDPSQPPLGTLRLGLDPRRLLFPEIQAWPGHSSSAEVLLLRREGTSVMLLNDIRHFGQSSLRQLIPAAPGTIFEKVGMPGMEGTIRGLDYRGVPVLAAVRAIPDSSWFLVAKIDADESFAAIRGAGVWVLLLATLLILLTAAIVALSWRHQRAVFYMREYRAERAHRALRGQYDYLSKYANDIIFLMDDQNRIIEANDRAVDTYGYSREDLVGMDVRELIEFGSERSLSQPPTNIERPGYEGIVFQAEHRRRDGTHFPVEISSRLIETEGRRYRQNIVRDITERRDAQKALLRSERRYREALENIELIAVLLDPAGKVTFCNDFLLSLTGWSCDEVIGHDWFSLFVPEETREEFGHLFRSTSDFRNFPTHFENEILTRGGARRTISWSSTVLRDDEGQITMVTSIGQDITERKQAERALQESEYRYRTLLEASPDLITHFNRQMQYLYISPGIHNYLGIGPEAIVGKKPSEIGIGAVAVDIERALTRVFESGMPVEVEINMDTSFGKTTYNWRVMPLRNDAGEVDAAIGIARDITGQRMAEERYESLFETMTSGFAVHEMVFDSAGQPVDYRFLSINPSFEKLTGLKKDEIIGRTVREVLPEVEDVWIERYGQVVLTGEPQHFEERALSMDKFFQVTAYRTAPGEFATIFSDVTERKRLQTQLAEVQRLESIGRLAGGIAHDFNNLLTVINGYSQLALTGLEEDSALHQQIAQIRKAGDRAASLTSQLLAFSRKQVVKPELLELNSIISESQSLLHRLIGEDVDLTVRLSPELGLILADSGQIHQVLMNLAVNARDAMPLGGSLSIETQNVIVGESGGEAGTCHPGPYVRLTVSDNGIGMSEETLERIFEPFFTTKARGTGTGLGLSMVYGIVQQSGGCVAVSSRLGQGTSFRIYLPRKDGTVERVEDVAVVSQLTGKETILVVEDQREVRIFAALVLKSLGYQVLEAADGYAALQILDGCTENIHLMLTDVVMPGMNGRELAERVKSLRPSIRVLFMSGYTDDTIATHGIHQTELTVLQKPFSQETLATRIRSVLEA